MINILFLHAGAEMYGADKVLLDLIRNLDKKKYKPYVILPTSGILVNYFERNNIDVEVIPYPIIRRKYFNPRGIIKYARDLFIYSKKLAYISRKKKIDIVHTNTAAVLEGSYVSWRLKIPQLWSIHEIIVSPKLMFKFTSKLISSFSDITITDSIAVKQHLKSSGFFNKKSIKVIYNGVDNKRFSPNVDFSYLKEEWGIPKDAKVIGMMGRVNSWKGQNDFLKAANIVMEKNLDVYTVFIGSAFEGEEWRERELENSINQSPFKKRIINVGYRTDSEAIYNLYDVFVLPSTNPDPLPTVVLEAMSTGKPIIGYRHGGVCEMVEDGVNGILADVGNPENLAQKIDLLITDDDLRLRMGKESRKRLLDNFSIEAYIRNYSNEYDHLI
ncbi:glycosyltransferase family 4 protein [Candidatus Enterococcus ferrettii]|uniref:Uncharacterized protein n=1 Tax=Candidatus Enterococcus ferrettii TaxID=2815324 RepID=A0ABV0EIC2_9ENTE|nr:glycosyltransferase family 4 protein [Enterococcus sp. 665A]MBO1340536.1 glycosyltransferase family 4 protein [Enterococcus sp. 665A]